MSVRKLDTTEATLPLAEYAQQTGDGPIVVTVDGRPVAAVVPIENADLETVTLSEHPRFLEVIERSRVRHQSEGGLTSDEVRRLFNGEE